MKRFISLLLLSAFIFSCKTPEVDLMPIDKLTGGKEKKWRAAEIWINGEDHALNNPCYSDGVALFSKGNIDNPDFPGPYYQLKFNNPSCQNDEPAYFFKLSKDTTQIFFYINYEAMIHENSSAAIIWNILEFEDDRFVIEILGGGTKFVFQFP